MKLQVALDGELQPSLAILRAVAPYVGIAEIGTPLIYREGMHAVRVLRQHFPQVTLLADLKIMDAGEEEAAIAFVAGADLVTVLGVTNDSTVRGAVTAARRAGKQIMVDLMRVADPVQRGRELLAMGCDYLCVHTAHDMQSSGHSPLETLTHLRHELPDALIAAAGGINLYTIDTIVALRPEIVVVGSAITQAADVTGTARALHARISQPVSH
jgi:3-hexulose-6-phosphate synthase